MKRLKHRKAPKGITGAVRLFVMWGRKPLRRGDGKVNQNYNMPGWTYHPTKGFRKS